MQTILRTDNITKKYKDFTAVDKLNISVDKGDIYGFIGQNGAGKTTTIRLLLNILKPTDGYIELFGERITKNNVYTVLKRIGSIIEIPGFYLNLTGRENLNLHRIMMGVSDKSEIERALKTVCLQDAGNKKVRHYSLGMKQRLGIARALLHNPELLILDEPTNGLDPKGIVNISVQDENVSGLVTKLLVDNNITVSESKLITTTLEEYKIVIVISHNQELVKFAAKTIQM